MSELYWVGVLSNMHMVLGFLSLLFGLCSIICFITAIEEGTRHWTVPAAAVLAALFFVMLAGFSVTPDYQMAQEMREQIMNARKDEQ